jgi:DNA-binding YbaB/EbfC family protein
MAKGFGGFSGGGNMQALLQQTQKMQRDMQKAQEEAEGFLAEGSAGGGSVKITVNGKNEVITVSIRPEAVDPSDVEMLQDLVRQAANDALNKVRENTNERLAKVTAGFNIPGLL